MNALLAESGAGRLTEIQRAVREHFQEGGSIGAVVLVLLGAAALVFLAYWLTRQQRKPASPRRVNDSRRLYQDLLRRLDLTASQRHRLDTLAKELRLKHPAILLLSPTIFDRCTDQWRSQHRRGDHPLDGPDGDGVFSPIRAVLFP